MAKLDLIEEYFFLAVAFLFLALAYNLNLSSIYSSMLYLSIFLYITAPFKLIPLRRPNRSKLESTLWGIIPAVGFIYFYTQLTTTKTMAQVFATTAFGDNVFISKIVFGILIPLVESPFFFWLLILWLLYITKERWMSIDAFSVKGLTYNTFISALFTAFHWTAKGVTNNVELMATFVFGFISILLILYFKQLWEALVLHIVVNSYSVELVTRAMLTSPVFIGIAGIAGYVIFAKPKSKRFRL